MKYNMDMKTNYKLITGLFLLFQIVLVSKGWSQPIEARYINDRNDIAITNNTNNYTIFIFKDRNGYKIIRDDYGNKSVQLQKINKLYPLNSDLKSTVFLSENIDLRDNLIINAGKSISVRVKETNKTVIIRWYYWDEKTFNYGGEYPVSPLSPSNTVSPSTPEKTPAENPITKNATPNPAPELIPKT